MRPWRFFLFILLISFTFEAFPAVFVVTSNADSGPGTLREALTLAAANGNAEKDYINFNLPGTSEAGRTINLLTELPEISSNLVVDGTTQLGAKFGVSSAHVALFFKSVPGRALSGLRIIGQHDVEIYGLFIKNISQSDYADNLGIELADDIDITIGAAHKGNVVDGFFFPLTVNDTEVRKIKQTFKNLTLKDNFFSIEPDGETRSANPGRGVDISTINGRVIVGGTEDEGNLSSRGINFALSDFILSGNYNSKIPTNVLIKNNKIGVDYKVNHSWSDSEGITPSAPVYTYEIVDNVLAGFPNAIYLITIGKNMPVTILRNFIGTDKKLNQKIETGGIFVSTSTQISIGSDNPADGNYITNCLPILIGRETNCTVNKNSIYCPTQALKMHYTYPDAFPYPEIEIRNIRPSGVSGIATPNSNVELFYSDVCNTCSPQTYFASTRSDGNGNWTYSGNISGTVIASATFNGNTSEFTHTSINTHDIKVINVCGDHGLGSITGAIPTSAANIKWVDEKGKIVGHDADLLNVPLGKYKLIVNNGDCADSTSFFEIKKTVTQLPQYSVTTVASCFGGKTGSVIVATDALVKTLRWVDDQGGPAGNQPALTNIAAGTYKLYITDQNGCENLYNTYTVDEVPEFKVASTGQTVDDQCGLNTGNVNNVNITGGVPPYTYKWTDAAGKQIGIESNISNLAAGNYVLNVVDTRCGNVDIPYTITEESAEVAAPSVSDIQLCSSGSGLLSVNNASPAVTYRLYETENSAHQIDEQKGGKFNINVTANRSYFVTQLNGTCESSRAEVKIAVGLSTINIANAFTPNGDGINDYWKINNIESYPDALVQVFSRYGQKVFESKGYAKPFDGTMNGKKLPPGVYYYIINLNTNCNVLSGSLTMIR